MDYDFLNPAYFGRGKVQFTAPLGVTGIVNQQSGWGENWSELASTPGALQLPPGRFVGNAKGLEILPQVDRPNVTAWDTSSRLIVQGVEASLTMFGHGARNLANALHAVRRQANTTHVTDAFATGRASVEAGSMYFTRDLVDCDMPVTVQPSWTTWTEGVQWEREAFGVRIIAGFSGPYGSTLNVGFTPQGGAERLEALTATSSEIGLVYTGTNRADGSPARLDCYRATPLLGDPLRPISDEAGTVTLKFQLKPVLSQPDQRLRWYTLLRGQAPF